MLQPDIEPADIEQARHNLNAIADQPKPPSNAKKIEYRKQFISEVINALSNKLRAKAIFRRMDFELLKWTREILDFVLDEKETEHEAQKEKDQKRQDILQQVSELLTDHDFTLDELLPNGLDDLKPKKNKKPRTYKKRNEGPTTVDDDYQGRTITYKFKWHIFDVDFYWTGTGYLPKPLRCHLAKGHTLDSCLLTKDQWIRTKDKMRHHIPTRFQESFDKLWNEANRQGIAKKRSELVLEANIRQ